MCVAEGTLIETARGQVPIERMTASDLVMTRAGLAPLKWVGRTGESPKLMEISTAKSTLRVTECHPIFLPETNEFASARNVAPSDSLLESRRWASVGRQSHGVAAGGTRCRQGITEMERLGCFIVEFTRRTLNRWGQALTCIMLTMIQRTIIPQILNPLPALNTTQNTNGSASMFLRANLSEDVLSAGKKPGPSGLSLLHI